MTVSRVFRDDPRVKPATRRRVYQVARELGYRPDAAARRLKMGLQDIVGLAFADEDGSISTENVIRRFAPFLAKLGPALEAKNLHLMIGHLGQSITLADVDSRLPQIVGTGYTSRLVVLSHMWPQLADALRRLRVPTIVVDGPACGLEAVQRDETRAVETLVDHLTELGHRRIAFLNQPGPRVRHYRDELWPRGYFKALTRHQLVPMPGWDAFSDQSEALDRLLALPERPTAIITYDEVMAHSVIQFLSRRGLAVPEDISVAAVLNSGAAVGIAPVITHIDFPCQKVVERVAELCAVPPPRPAATDDEPRLMTIPGKLVASGEHASTAPCRA